MSQEIKKIQLSLNVARLICPVYLSPFDMAQFNLANKILDKQTKPNG